MKLAKLIASRAIFLSAATNQAVQLFKTKGTLTLPKGYKLVQILGEGLSSYLGYVAQSKKNILVVFRGTEDLFDILKDFNFWQTPYPFVENAGKTHKGFTQIYSTSVRQQLYKALQHISSSKKLFIAGHSLGGAMATLAALDLAVNTPFKKPIVYTFGSPRVGDPTFTQVFNQKVKDSIRITNVFDIVPLFPASFMTIKYKQVHRKLPITFQYFNLVKNHEIIHYYQQLATLNPAYAKHLCQRNPGFCPIITAKKENTLKTLTLFPKKG